MNCDCGPCDSHKDIRKAHFIVIRKGRGQINVCFDCILPSDKEVGQI